MSNSRFQTVYAQECVCVRVIVVLSLQLPATRSVVHRVVWLHAVRGGGVCRDTSMRFVQILDLRAL